MSAWDDASRDPEEILVIRDAPVGFWWRQVGTDIEVRVGDVPHPQHGIGWQHQYAPTGLLTIHLAGEPAPPASDPALDPIEVPGETIIHPAVWDADRLEWKTPDA